jgi:hypothetical protein
VLPSLGCPVSLSVKLVKPCSSKNTKIAYLFQHEQPTRRHWGASQAKLTPEAQQRKGIKPVVAVHRRDAFCQGWLSNPTKIRLRKTQANATRNNSAIVCNVIPRMQA